VGLLDVRRRWKRYVRGLDIPSACDAPTLCARISSHPDRAGRPIRLLPMPLSVGGPCGLWLATARSDYIVFEADTTVLHQNHIIAHELGHLVLKHSAQQVVSDEALGRLASHIDPATVRLMLGRSRYEEREEREAETLASLLQQRLIERRPPPERRVPSETTEIIDRLSRTLEREWYR
jgi:hypothetical protein